MFCLGLALRALGLLGLWVVWFAFGFVTVGDFAVGVFVGWVLGFIGFGGV